MDRLNDLERAVVEKLLYGDKPLLHALRLQAQFARVKSREYSGVGFFTNFVTGPEAPPAPNTNMQLRDVEAEIDGVQNGAGFVLFIKNGRLDFLEGYTYDEPWPTDVKEFSLRYHSEDRDLDF